MKDLVPRLCLGTQIREALPRATGTRGRASQKPRSQAEPGNEIDLVGSAFPGSAWERRSARLCLAQRKTKTRGRASQQIRPQAEPGNEIPIPRHPRSPTLTLP